MEKVLFLDSSGDLFSSMLPLLKAKGVDAERVISSEQALTYLREGKYGKLLCHFPHINGSDFEFVSSLHTRLRLPFQTFVVGPDSVPAAVRALQNGASHYWANSIPASELDKYFGDPSRPSPLAAGTRREETLLQIIKEIALTMELDGLANVLIDSALELARGDAGILFLWDEKHGTFNVKAIRGISGQEESPAYFGLSQEKYQQILHERQPVFVHDPQPPMYSASRERVDAMIAAPIWWKEDPLALLIIFKFQAGEQSFSPDDFQHISRLAREISGAVHNAIIHYKTKELTIKDDLTDAYNRRYFDRYLEDEFFRATRYRSNLSLIFFDVDNLKDVNVRYGHLNGSKTLQEIAQRMILTVRGIDKVVRYGGDEFCVLLPETDTNGAFQVAERIRATISETPFSINDSVHVNITGSLGIASFPQHANTKEELIRQADRAMFAIKNKSKNAIGIAEVVSPT